MTPLETIQQFKKMIDFYYAGVFGITTLKKNFDKLVIAYYNENLKEKEEKHEQES